MQIVIDISEDEYKNICEGVEASKKLDYSIPSIFEAVRNGTPLPKGHGRLIDISEYEDKYFNTAISFDDGNHIHKIYASFIPTIIPADTESGGEE